MKNKNLKKNENNSVKSLVKKVLVASLLINIVYFIFDYFNFFTFIGINLRKINWEIASIVISNVIVIGLYLITYFVIDKRSLDVNNNKREIAKLSLLKVYEKCLEMIDLFDLDDVVKCAAMKCDFNKLSFQDSVMQQYLNIPFESENVILDFAKSGIISAEEYGDYLEIQNDYKAHIRTKLLFFDRKVLQHYKKDELLQHIEKSQNSLKE